MLIQELHYQSFFRKHPMTKQQFMASRRLLWLAVADQTRQATIAAASIVGSKVSLLALAALTIATAGVLNHRQHVENLSATISEQAELRRTHAALQADYLALKTGSVKLTFSGQPTAVNDFLSSVYTNQLGLKK